MNYYALLIVPFVGLWICAILRWPRAMLLAFALAFMAGWAIFKMTRIQ